MRARKVGGHGKGPGFRGLQEVDLVSEGGLESGTGPLMAQQTSRW
jgi:hypothetical protein